MLPPGPPAPLESFLGPRPGADETSMSMEEMAASIQTVATNAQSLASYVRGVRARR
jgi:hypothetical protein